MASILSPVALAAITACVVATAVGAGIILQPTKDRDPPAARGPNVSIDVVAPREPVPEPGSVMDVGDLADGYTHRGYVQQADAYALPHDVLRDDPPARPEPRRVEPPREIAPPPAPPPVIAERRERPRRWSFGFDAPGPDYAAERRERIARLEDQRRLEEARMDERYEDRGETFEPRDDRGREALPDRDRRGRERQWYRSDGTRAPDREIFY